MDGFEVSRCDLGLTHMVGWVTDQARLYSTLEVLRDLNIELVSVNSVESPVPQSREATWSDTPTGETNG
jgi:hypothetical protein